MKHKKIKILFSIISISLIIILYLFFNNTIKDRNSLKNYDKNIDLTGVSYSWKTSLNVHTTGTSILIISPFREGFEIPSEIEVDILVDDKVIYSKELSYIPNSNTSLWGEYTDILLTPDYFEFKKDLENVSLAIKFTDDKEIIKLIKR